jgi:glycosyltransferase involved in cell wall biosynthesis
MSLTPNASVIIPCYNSAWSLLRLAENFRQIEHGNFEIIFVDDGNLV